MVSRWSPFNFSYGTSKPREGGGGRDCSKKRKRRTTIEGTEWITGHKRIREKGTWWKRQHHKIHNSRSKVQCNLSWHFCDRWLIQPIPSLFPVRLFFHGSFRSFSFFTVGKTDYCSLSPQSVALWLLSRKLSLELDPHSRISAVPLL